MRYVFAKQSCMLASAMMLAITTVSGPSAYAGEVVAYDEAPANLDPLEHQALEQHRAELMRISGVSLVYVANDRNIVVRVRKITPALDQKTPKELDGCRVKVVSVEDVVQRHLHELAQIAGEDQFFSAGVESFPDGQLAIVVRVRRPSWQQAEDVPTNIEGIPLRVLVAQDPLTN
jgi:type II secretory pathway component GspD/PulD (secretin)